MSESDSSDGMHLAAPTLCIQKSLERLREGEGGKRNEADGGKEGGLPFGGRNEREKRATKREINRDED